MRLHPDMHYNTDTNILTAMSVFCYVLFIITLQSLAGIMTIVAASTTAIWNIYKFTMDRKDRKQAHQKEMNGKVYIEKTESVKNPKNE